MSQYLLEILTQKTYGGISDGSPFNFAFFSLAKASCTRSLGCRHIPFNIGTSVSITSAAMRRNMLEPASSIKEEHVSGENETQSRVNF
jgi:hypothetical protein